jgi:integrase
LLGSAITAIFGCGRGAEVANQFNKAYSRILGSAGIREKATFHDLRRSAITNWLYRGLSVHEVRELAVHMGNLGYKS